MIEKDASKTGDDAKKRVKYKNVKNLYCPFCGIRCKDGQSLGGHIRIHKNEPHYKKILNSGSCLTSPSTLKKDKKNGNDNGAKKVVGSPASRSANIKKEFKCYFCGEICKDGLQYGGHVRKHISEPNYREVLGIAKLDRDRGISN